MCTTNGTTYDNQCWYELNYCRGQEKKFVYHPGSCEGKWKVSITQEKFLLSRIPSVPQSTDPSIHSSIHPSIHLFIHPPRHPYIYQFIQASINPSIHPGIHVSINSSIYTFMYPPIFQSFHQLFEFSSLSKAVLFSFYLNDGACRHECRFLSYLMKIHFLIKYLSWCIPYRLPISAGQDRTSRAKMVRFKLWNGHFPAIPLLSWKAGSCTNHRHPHEFEWLRNRSWRCNVMDWRFKHGKLYSLCHAVWKKIKKLQPICNNYLGGIPRCTAKRNDGNYQDERVVVWNQLRESDFFKS